MIVTAIIGLLASIAIPAFVKARRKAQREKCRQNQRVIWESINRYCMETGTGMSEGEWPNLCAARNRLAPGRSALYVRNWDVFECPIADSQDQHDYSYVFDDDGEMICCNNNSAAVRNAHNEQPVLAVASP
ncbi:type II secretion system protein [Verrucomicrobiota bacterium]